MHEKCCIRPPNISISLTFSNSSPINPRTMKPQLGLIARPKNPLRLCQWWAPGLHTKAPGITGKSKRFLKSAETAAKESLLTGELSDSRRDVQTPQQVPKGFLAVYVGSELRRFVIPAIYLSMPDFRVLMDRVGEEYGFEQEGRIEIPCEEEDFEEILHKCLVMRQMMSKNKKKNNYMVLT